MALSYTYIQTQQMIATELGERTNLLAGSGVWAPIKNAILSAIAKWEREPFYFNEVYNSASPLFSTVAGQELYTSSDAAGIASAPQIEELRALVSSNWMTLTKRSWSFMNDISTNPSARGQPTDWAYFGQQIRLYPIPDQVYSIAATRLQRVTALSADSDTNVWLQDGFDLIKTEAKLHLARNILRDRELAADCEAQIYGPRGYLYMLKAESTRRAKSRIRPTAF